MFSADIVIGAVRSRVAAPKRFARNAVWREGVTQPSIALRRLLEISLTTLPTDSAMASSTA